MNKIEIPYEYKIELVKSYLYKRLPEDDFTELCNTVKGFSELYDSVNEKYTKIREVLIPQKELVKQRVPINISVGEMIDKGIESIGEILDNIAAFILPDSPQVSMAGVVTRSSEDEDEITGKLEAGSIDELATAILDLITKLATVDKDNIVIWLRVEYGYDEETERFTMTDNFDSIKGKIIEMLNDNEISSIDCMYFSIIKKDKIDE